MNREPHKKSIEVSEEDINRMKELDDTAYDALKAQAAVLSKYFNCDIGMVIVQPLKFSQRANFKGTVWIYDANWNIVGEYDYDLGVCIAY